MQVSADSNTFSEPGQRNYMASEWYRSFSESVELSPSRKNIWAPQNTTCSSGPILSFDYLSCPRTFQPAAPTATVATAEAAAAATSLAVIATPTYPEYALCYPICHTNGSSPAHFPLDPTKGASLYAAYCRPVAASPLHYNNSLVVAKTVTENYTESIDNDDCIDWPCLVNRIVRDNDQQASIFLQQKLHDSQPLIKTEILNTISSRCLEICTNRVGNFLLQRCFEHASIDIINMILCQLHGHMVEISLSPYGCHVLQKALDVVPDVCCVQIVQELLPATKVTVCDKYASHVWQRLLEVSSVDVIEKQILPQFQRSIAHTKWKQIALEDTGSLIIQFLISHCSPESVQFLVQELAHDCGPLCTSRWGNWIVTRIIEMKFWPEKLPLLREYQNGVIQYILDHCIPLSFDVFGSRIIAKLFKMDDKAFITQYINRICQAATDSSDMTHLVIITLNPQGLSLIQTLIHNGLYTHRKMLRQVLKAQNTYFKGSKNAIRCLQLIDQYCNHADYS